MRQRALSAVIFVPPLLIVLALGEPWFGALIAVFVAIAAWEAGRLLRGAGYAAAPWLVVAGALAVAADVAAPAWLAGYGDLLIAAAVVPPGEVTWARNSSGDSPVSASRAADPSNVPITSWRDTSRESPWCTPASINASTTR